MTEVILTDANGRTLRAGIDVGGIVIPEVHMDLKKSKSIFDDLPNLQFRDDDVMLCTFPKSGTNSVYEILSMINNRAAERIASYKFLSTIESQTKESVDALNSSRVLNSHLRPSLLPKGLSSYKTKTILCVRNPKDVAVSFYHHMVGFSGYGYTGSFAGWLPMFLEGNLEYGKYTDYLLGWEKAITKGLDFPLQLVYYEDLKDTEKELNKLLQFLDVDLDKTLKERIISACSFEKMAKEKEIVPKEQREGILRGGFNFFRKGFFLTVFISFLLELLLIFTFYITF